MATVPTDAALDGAEPADPPPTRAATSARPAAAGFAAPYPPWTGGSMRARPPASAGTSAPPVIRRFDTPPEPTPDQVLEAVAARTDRTWVPLAVIAIGTPLIGLVWVLLEVFRDLRWPPPM